ncbi:MAG: TIGR03960 family B12-binding radical SAM protein [Ruminococcus sp.]|nr:TIGR03960 family B12-binding radical SAM protein [Ruminococcus sp.]
MNLKEKIEKHLMEVQKPSRYIGGEVGSIVKDKASTDVSFAFCFPDTYDIGMSHIGMKILYSLINSRENFRCERCYAPDVDFEKIMRENDIPLYSLESLEPVRDFDFIGFTMQYELSYTNVLNMLDLAGIPIFAKDRTSELTQIVAAGGPCVCNPEPLADFFDLFILGEGEEVNLELMELFNEMKKQGADRLEFLRKAAQIEGIYVPRFYNFSYKADGTIEKMTVTDNAPTKITKRIIKDFDNVFYPENFVVPFTEIVHDRVSVEVLRGCIRGCRFCQAGFIYRPFREKSPDTIYNETKCLCENTGYDEVSLASLSTSDHSQIDEMLTKLIDYTAAERINLSLPSLRVDNFTEELLEKIKKVRKSGLTFAAEGGTQRLRDVINKNVTEEEIMSTCKIAFEGGYSSVKLYFMMGLPTETDEDIIGIAELAQRILDLYYSIENRPKGRSPQISVSCATFVPKPFTPFQFEPQDTRAEIERKQKLLLDSVKSKKIKVSYHDSDVSQLEAVLAKGDRRLCDVVYTAWQMGCRFDSWSEHFKFGTWLEAFEKCGVDPAFYANRKAEYDEILPWDHLDYMVTKEFFIRENKTAHTAVTTPNCRQKCSGCGVNKAAGRDCFC